MKILIDLTSLYDHLSGIERYAKEISLSMLDTEPGHEYVLVFKNQIDKDFLRYTSASNVETIVLRTKMGGPIGKLLFGQLYLPIKLYQIKADAYLFLAFPEPLLFFKSAIFSTIHDMAAFDEGDTLKTFSRIYFKLSYYHAKLFAKRIITVSRFSANRICTILKMPKKRILIAFDGVESRRFIDRDVENGDLKAYGLPERYALSLSTLEPRKNLVALLDAYENLILKGIDLPDLVLAGRMGWKEDKLLEGYLDSLRQKVHLPGFIDDADITKLYSNASYFINTSKYEGFGIPPLEAMKCATPVISSDIEAAREVLGDVPIFFDINNPRSLEDAIIKMEALLTDKGALLRMQRAGIKRAKHFNWDYSAKRIICNMEKLYDHGR